MFSYLPDAFIGFLTVLCNTETLAMMHFCATFRPMRWPHTHTRMRNVGRCEKGAKTSF